MMSLFIRFLCSSALFISFSNFAYSAQLEPSSEGMEIAKRVIYAKIYSSPKLAAMVDLANAKMEWKPSSVEGLFYGVFWANYKLDNGQIMRSPSRFYVKDLGRNSMVVIGAFVDSNGRIPDGMSLKAVTVGGVEDKLNSDTSKGFPLDPNSVVKKGDDRIVVFTDPDCPYCKRTLPALLELSKMKNVQLEIYYTPIDSLHPNARVKSLVLLSIEPNQRLLAESVIENINSGDRDVLLGVLSASGIHASEKMKVAARGSLTFGEDLAAKYGIRGTPNILIPSTRKAIQGSATTDEILAKLK